MRRTTTAPGGTSASPKNRTRPEKPPLLPSEVEGAVATAALLHVAYRRRPQGRLVEVGLHDAMSALAGVVAPVREPMQYRGQWSKPGWYYFAGLDEHVSYESRFEGAHLMLLDFEGAATAVVPQPFRLHWRAEKAARRHTPDFLVWRKDGTGVVIDVKGDSACGGAEERARVRGDTTGLREDRIAVRRRGRHPADSAAQRPVARRVQDAARLPGSAGGAQGGSRRTGTG